MTVCPLVSDLVCCFHILPDPCTRHQTLPYYPGPLIADLSILLADLSGPLGTIAFDYRTSAVFVRLPPVMPLEAASIGGGSENYERASAHAARRSVC